MDCCTPKRKLVCGHCSCLSLLFVIFFIALPLAGFLNLGLNLKTNDEDCVLKDLRGAEDITKVGHSSGFMCADDRQKQMLQTYVNLEGEPDGAIFLLKGIKTTMTKADYSAIERGEDSDYFMAFAPNMTDGSAANWPEGMSFHPYGMAVTPSWVDEPLKLYVLNNAWNEGHVRIEIFTIQTNADGDATGLTWTHAMASEELSAAHFGGFNGIAVTGPDMIYAANWMKAPYVRPDEEGYTDKQEKPIDLTGGVTKIIYIKYDPETEKTSFKVAAEGFKLLKAVSLNSDGTVLYANDMVGKSVVVFDNKASTGTLTKIEGTNTFYNPYFTDNLKYDEKLDTIWGGTAYSTGIFSSEGGRTPQDWDTATLDPTNIGGAIEMRMKDGVMQHRVHVVSAKLNEWSNAVRIQNTLVLGSWLDGFLLCPYNDDAKWVDMSTGGTALFWLATVMVLAADGYIFRRQWKNLSDGYSKQ